MIVSRLAARRCCRLQSCVCLALGLGALGNVVPVYAVNPPRVTALPPVSGQGAGGAGQHDRFLHQPVVTGVSPKRGPAVGGTTVTITGAAFTSVTRVYFGSEAATYFTVNSSRSITAVTPEAAGRVDVRVSTTHGTSTPSNHDRFAFAPEVNEIRPGSGPAGNETPVTIIGSGFAVGSDATVIKFGSLATESVECQTTTRCVAITPRNRAGAVHVTATVENVVSEAKAARFRFLTGIFLVGREGRAPRTELRDLVSLEIRPGEYASCYPYPEGELVANEGEPEIVAYGEVPYIGGCDPPPNDWFGLLSGFSMRIHRDRSVRIAGSLGGDFYGCVYAGGALTGHFTGEPYYYLAVAASARFRLVRNEEQEAWEQQLDEVRAEIKALEEESTRTPEENAQLAALRKQKIELEKKVAETGELCQARARVHMVVEDEGANVLVGR